MAVAGVIEGSPGRIPRRPHFQEDPVFAPIPTPALAETSSDTDAGKDSPSNTFRKTRSISMPTDGTGRLVPCPVLQLHSLVTSHVHNAHQYLSLLSGGDRDRPEHGVRASQSHHRRAPLQPCHLQGEPPFSLCLWALVQSSALNME